MAFKGCLRRPLPYSGTTSGSRLATARLQPHPQSDQHQTDKKPAQFTTEGPHPQNLCLQTQDPGTDDLQHRHVHLEAVADQINRSNQPGSTLNLLNHHRFQGFTHRLPPLKPPNPTLPPRVPQARVHLLRHHYGLLRQKHPHLLRLLTRELLIRQGQLRPPQ